VHGNKRVVEVEGGTKENGTYIKIRTGNGNVRLEGNQRKINQENLYGSHHVVFATT
jgi:hypothetical protein